MKAYDISQEVFSCEVYNLTAFSMCAHNGIVTGNDATEIIEKAKKQSSD